MGRSISHLQIILVLMTKLQRKIFFFKVDLTMIESKEINMIYIKNTKYMLA